MVNRQLRDVIDLEMLQYIQDHFSEAVGLAFIAVDYKGRQVTKTSGYRSFCSIGQKRKNFKELCAQCDAHGGLHSTITGQPYIYYCHADLVDFAVPIISDGSYMGAVLGGQAKLSTLDAQKLDRIIPQRINWQDDPELKRYHQEIVTLPFEKIKATVILLQNMIQYQMEEKQQALIGKELEEKSKALIEERAQRLELEKMQESELSVIGGQADYEFFFSMLNIISKLAFQEKAPKTEEAVYDFAKMLRYAMSNEHIVSLGEDLDYAERLLRLQQTRLTGRLIYELKVPEELRATICPFMMLRPIIENALKYAVTSNGSNGLIRIWAEKLGDDLLLTVGDNGEGMSSEKIAAVLEQGDHEEYRQKKMSLYDMQRKLQRYFGRNYGLHIKSIDDGISGTEVNILLPISSNAVID